MLAVLLAIDRTSTHHFAFIRNNLYYSIFHGYTFCKEAEGFPTLSILPYKKDKYGRI